MLPNNGARDFDFINLVKEALMKFKDVFSKARSKSCLYGRDETLWARNTKEEMNF